MAEVRKQPQEPVGGSAAESARAELDRNRITATALAMIDADGFAAFSMRRLARRLGVGTMTLYGYFRSREELLDSVVDAGAAAIPLDVPPGGWRDRLAGLMTQLREALLAHPNVIELRLDRPFLSPGALRFADTVTAVLLDAGFDSERAALAYRSLLGFTLGSVAYLSGPAAKIDPGEIEPMLAAAPAGEYAAIRCTILDHERLSPKRLFEFGLGRMLDGLEGELGRTRLASRP